VSSITETAPASPLSGMRILMVEDEMVLAMLLDDVLTGLGAQVLTASSVSKALGLAATEALTGAVLDINVRGEAIYPVSEELARRGIPFVFTTGYGSKGVREEDRHRPMLRKPFRAEALEHIMTTAFAIS
jgi:CheY-like chemotaxis protein